MFSPEPEPPDGWVPFRDIWANIPKDHIHSWSVCPPEEWWTLGRWHSISGPDAPIPYPREWCQGCLKVQERVPGRREQVEVRVIKKERCLKKEVKEVFEEEKEEEKVSEVMLREARGEVTPTAKPRKTGSKIRSPGAKVRSLTRLLQFHQHLSEEHGLPPSHLQEKMRLEQETTPSPVPPFLPMMLGEGKGEGRDLRGEFERMGADALLPLFAPPAGAPGGGNKEVD